LVAEAREGEGDLNQEQPAFAKATAGEGGLAQLARAPALHAGGQRFESVILHFTRRSPQGEGGSPNKTQFLIADISPIRGPLFKGIKIGSNPIYVAVVPFREYWSKSLA
jgi:hypothetical protein